MNPKILIAFLGGAAAAGIIGFVVTSRSGQPSPRAEATPSTIAESAPPVERSIPSETTAAPAKTGGFRRATVDDARRNIPLPKPAPVTVKPSATPAPQPTQTTQTAQASQPPTVIFPNPNDNTPPPAPPKEEPVKGQVFRPDPVQKPSRREPETVTINAGTTLSIRLNQTLNSDRVAAGDSFSGTLDSALVVNDMVLAEKGARVSGKVVESDKAGRVKGVSKLAIELTQIQLSDGQRINLSTDPFVREGESSKKADAAKVGAGAAVGAALGAIFGGGKGAAVGAASGGAAGTGVVLATRGKPAQIDVESRIPFRLKSNHTVTEKIN